MIAGHKPSFGFDRFTPMSSPATVHSTDPSPNTFTNAAAYLFAPLGDLKSLRDELRESCRSWDLKGTILLSTEGINLFIAGAEARVHQLLGRLREFPGLSRLEAKFSVSKHQPFKRMLVKVKKEIIAFGVPGIDPAQAPAPRVSPKQLAQWLDEGKPLMLLDTRNEYEVRLGTFRNARSVAIDHFRNFPAAVDQLKDLPKEETIVTFCTGGIRCEKAAPYLLQQGFRNVLQLDGGILKYFEECGDKHFQGQCFVFDQRVGLSSDLYESGHGLCYVCQSLLSPADLADPLTVEGVSCPRCYQTPEQKQHDLLQKRNAKLKEIVTPLPGRLPVDNLRPLKVNARHAGLTLFEFVRTVFPQISEEAWRQHFDEGNLLDQQCQPLPRDHVVQPGDSYYSRERGQCEPDVCTDMEVLHEDSALVVVNKGAPLPVHPCGRYHRNTLSWMLRKLYAPQKPRPAHRLDANTSGLVVFTRTSTFARMLQPQFERGEVEKCYLARVQGHVTSDAFSCSAPLIGTVGRKGARIVDDLGQSALTEFSVIERLPDGDTLLQVWPRTGRTHQIRVHLWHQGWPIVGDPMYLPGGELGTQQTVDVTAAPLMLHAWRLSFAHPQHGGTMRLEAPPPSWASSVVIERLPAMEGPSEVPKTGPAIAVNKVNHGH